MKQIKFLAIMLAMMSICFGFVACGNDDDDDLSYTNSALVGTWWRNGESWEKWVFSSNGDFNCVNTVIQNLPQTRTGTYSLDDITLTIKIKAVAGSNSAYTNTYCVTKLTNSTLELIDLDDFDVLYFEK